MIALCKFVLLEDSVAIEVHTIDVQSNCLTNAVRLYQTGNWFVRWGFAVGKSYVDRFPFEIARVGLFRVALRTSLLADRHAALTTGTRLCNVKLATIAWHTHTGSAARRSAAATAASRALGTVAIRRSFAENFVGSRRNDVHRNFGERSLVGAWFGGRIIFRKKLFNVTVYFSILEVLTIREETDDEFSGLETIVLVRVPLLKEREKRRIIDRAGIQRGRTFT